MVEVIECRQAAGLCKNLRSKPMPYRFFEIQDAVENKLLYAVQNPLLV